MAETREDAMCFAVFYCAVEDAARAFEQTGIKTGKYEANDANDFIVILRSYAQKIGVTLPPPPSFATGQHARHIHQYYELRVLFATLFCRKYAHVSVKYEILADRFADLGSYVMAGLDMCRCYTWRSFTASAVRAYGKQIEAYSPSSEYFEAIDIFNVMFYNSVRDVKSKIKGVKCTSRNLRDHCREGMIGGYGLRRRTVGFGAGTNYHSLATRERLLRKLEARKQHADDDSC